MLKPFNDVSDSASRHMTTSNCSSQYCLNIRNSNLKKNKKIIWNMENRLAYDFSKAFLMFTLHSPFFLIILLLSLVSIWFPVIPHSLSKDLSLITAHNKMK